MNRSQIAARFARMIDVIATLIPEYMANPLDRQIASGNGAICFSGFRGTSDIEIVQRALALTQD